MMNLKLLASSLVFMLACGGDLPGNVDVPAPAPPECPPLKLDGLVGCRAGIAPTTAVVSLQRCGVVTVATALYSGKRYSSRDGKTFACEPAAACPPSADPPAFLCLQF